jgi:hypothetical protein
LAAVLVLQVFSPLVTTELPPLLPALLVEQLVQLVAAAAVTTTQIRLACLEALVVAAREGTPVTLAALEPLDKVTLVELESKRLPVAVAVLLPWEVMALAKLVVMVALEQTGTV